MFTGIIQSQRAVLSVEKRGDCMHVAVATPRAWRLKKGGSIAVDGMCVTAMPRARSFTFTLVPETLRRTKAREYTKGSRVNLERPLRFGAEIGGHFVQGHVDCTGRVERVRAHGRSRDVDIALPKRFLGRIAEKGSVALNGVSLTVARKTRRGFSVALVPYTLRATNLCELTRGTLVNIEFDVLRARLVRARKK